MIFFPPNHLDLRIKETIFPTHASFLFKPISICLIIFDVSFDVQPLLLFVTVHRSFRIDCSHFITLLQDYKLRGQLYAQNIHSYYCHCTRLEFTWLPESEEGLPSQGRGVSRILKIVYILEVYVGHDDWQFHYIRENALICFVLSKTKKYVSYGELQNLYYDVIDAVSHKPRSLYPSSTVVFLEIDFNITFLFKLFFQDATAPSESQPPHCPASTITHHFR